jgi:hypothetical protein
MHGNNEKVRTHTVTKAEVFAWDATTYGVRFEFDDGTADYAYSGGKEEAERDARDRIGEEMPARMNPQLRSAERMQRLKDERAGITTSAGPYPASRGQRRTLKTSRPL